MTAPTTLPDQPSTRSPAGHHIATRVAAAALALAVAYVHVKDQGGFPGSKEPSYVGLGYYLLELGGLLVAVALLVGAGRHTRRLWTLVLGVAAGPVAGFVLSRGPGLPDYTDDRGNWTEPLALVGLAVELTLLALAVTVLVRTGRNRTAAAG